MWRFLRQSCEVAFDGSCDGSGQLCEYAVILESQGRVRCVLVPDTGLVTTSLYSRRWKEGVRGKEEVSRTRQGKARGKTDIGHWGKGRTFGKERY